MDPIKPYQRICGKVDHAFLYEDWKPFVAVSFSPANDEMMWMEDLKKEDMQIHWWIVFNAYYLFSYTSAAKYEHLQIMH